MGETGKQQNEIAGKTETWGTAKIYFSSMPTSRRPFPLATGAAGCMLLSHFKSGFSQMAMCWSHMLTATKTREPQHNTTIYLFIYCKCGVL